MVKSAMKEEKTRKEKKFASESRIVKINTQSEEILLRK
jgi:hypothetical protein